MSAWRYAWRRYARGWRSGELLILSVALTVGVGTSCAVGLFTDRVRAALAAQSGETMGADLIVSARDALPDALLEQARADGLDAVSVYSLPSVVFHGETSRLASVKAVSAGYPPRGELRITDQPFGTERVAAGIPPPGEAWVDARLWTDLGLSAGAPLKLGDLDLKIGAVIAYEPDRGGSFGDLAPRLLINAADLPATQLMGAFSRVSYELMLAGPTTALEALDIPEDARAVTPQDASPAVRNALDTAQRFLDLAVLSALLLSGAAVAICARSYGTRLRDEVALLKCLGAHGNYIVTALAGSLLFAGVLAGLVGAAVGGLAQFVIVRLIGSLLDTELPAPTLWPLLSAQLVGLLMLLGFGLPPVLDARRVTPVRVFQRVDAGTSMSRLVPLAAVSAIAALLWWQTRDVKLAAYVLGGAAIAIAVLAGLALLLVRLLAPLRGRAGAAWRFGLGNVSRRRAATVAQVVALGLSLLALLLVSVSRTDLLETWRARLPDGTPNQFLINVLPDQVAPMNAFFAERGYDELKLWPMVRGRLVGLNGEAVSSESFDDPETRRWINREFNLSWTDTLGPDNTITDGQWWGESGQGQPWLSADDYAVERLGLKLGNTLTLAIADREVTLTVKNFRTVEWDSFQPNFFLLAPPGVLDPADANFLTSFYLPPDERALLRALVDRFPNVTVLDIDSVMREVRSIMDRITRAVEFIFIFTLVAGLTVLLAAIEGTRDERRREIGLLRALGARRSVVRQGVLTEYAVLGLLAGSVAAIGAQGLSWALAEFVFGIDYGPRPLLWLIGAGAGTAIVTSLGWFALRRTLDTPPNTVLRGE
ncbi:MAG: FtsX-like permease family protein [Pseudomonadota bacterium]|nr:FtsX-like permease family protein [Pseudomonadota bacterium]